MFQETIKGDSRGLQGYLKEVQRLFQCFSFKEVWRMFKEVPSLVPENFKLNFKGVLRLLNKVLFCNIGLHRSTWAEEGLVFLKGPLWITKYLHTSKRSLFYSLWLVILWKKNRSRKFLSILIWLYYLKNCSISRIFLSHVEVVINREVSD